MQVLVYFGASVEVRGPYQGSVPTFHLFETGFHGCPSIVAYADQVVSKLPELLRLHFPSPSPP